MKLYDVRRMMKDVLTCLPDEPFIETGDLCKRMAEMDESFWGAKSAFGRSLTPQRLGRAIHSSTGILATRNSARHRGYQTSGLQVAISDFIKEGL